MRKPWLGMAIAISMVFLARNSRSYVFEGQKWPTPATSYFVNITGPPSGDWNTPFSNAMAKWTTSTVFKFSVGGTTFWDPCSKPDSSGTKNGVKFSDTVCGDAWGDTTLGITERWFSGNTLIQGGIVFNNTKSWAVYDGPWYETPGFINVNDFQRVAVHELGHALGLDHEDNVPSIMATVEAIGNTITDPTPDDINGVNTLYSPSGSISATIFVPIVLSSSGINNSFFTSEMELTNRGATDATLQFIYTAALGQGNGTVSDSLPAAQQRIVPDAIAYLRLLGLLIPSSGNQGGTLIVRFSGLSAPSAAAVVVRTTTTVPKGRAGLAYAGIPTSTALTAPSYLCGLRQNNTDRSNVAVQNVGTSSDGNITLRLTVFSGDAAHPLSQRLPDITLSPGGFQQISGILAGLSLINGFVRVERMSGTAPYYAYAVINDQFNSDGSFVPPILESSLAGRTQLTLPVIVENSAFSTELVVTNWSSLKKTLKCRFVSDAIQTVDSTAHFLIEINPLAQLILPDFVQVLRAKTTSGIGPRGPAYVGPLFAEVSSGDITGVSLSARTSTPGGGGRYGLFYNSVPDGKASTTTAWIYDLQQNAETRSNLALVNTGEQDGSSSKFQIDLFDGTTGTQVNSFGVSLGASKWMQIGTILAQYAPGTPQGYARVTLTAGNNPFIAYGVINDGGQPGTRTGDGAFVASTP